MSWRPTWSPPRFLLAPRTPIRWVNAAPPPPLAMAMALQGLFPAPISSDFLFTLY